LACQLDVKFSDGAFKLHCVELCVGCHWLLPYLSVVVVSCSMCCAVIIALRCMVAQVLDCNNLLLVWLVACAS
jgi:hypothetical protein